MARLKDVCTRIQDGAHESPRALLESPGEGRFIYLTSKNIRTNRLDLDDVKYVEREFHDRIYPRCPPRVGDVLLTKDGAGTGNVALNTIAEPVSVLSSVCLIQTDPTVLLPSFLCYYIQSPVGFANITGQMTGTAIRRIILRDIKCALIPLPPVPEQERIVAVLDEALAGLALAERDAERNLENAAGLMVGHLQAVFARPAATWSNRRIADIADCSLGKMLDRAKNRGDLQPYLRNVCVRWFGFDLSDLNEMRFLPHEEEKYTAVTGDVLVCEGGYPGRAAIWTDDRPVYFQKAVHRVRFSEPDLNRWFVYYLYAQDACGALKRYFTGTGIQHFTGASLARLEMPVPPSAELRAHVARFSELHDQTRRLESIYQRKLAALEELKQSLLHEAFSGNL